MALLEFLWALLHQKMVMVFLGICAGTAAFIHLVPPSIPSFGMILPVVCMIIGGIAGSYLHKGIVKFSEALSYEKEPHRS